MARASVLHCVLKDYVPLLVDAVKQPKEIASIVHPDQHSPKKQLLEFCYML